MGFLDNYLERLRGNGKSSLAQSVSGTAGRFCSDFLDQFDFCSQASALLVGNVQSGKTGQMFGICAAAADGGFRTFVILTTDSVLLQQQTFERALRDLPDFCVCDETDTIRLEENDSVRPVLIVLKKNPRTLRRWSKTFAVTRVLQGNPLFILDDEADAASLNTLVNQEDVSTINRHLADIRGNASSSVYLEVTGTPQALFLQTRKSGWRPDYVLYFEPGREYLGGNFFFPERGPVPACVAFTDELDDPVKTFVLRHLAAAAVLFSKGAIAANALVHNSARTSEHGKCADRIRSILQSLKEDPELTKSLLAETVSELNRTSIAPLNGKEIAEAVCSSILPAAQVQIRNTDNNGEGEQGAFSSGVSFIVGGNALGRGVTIPALATVLYERVSKRPQADTMWQHCRLFGYDRDPELVRIYLPRHLAKLLTEINATNNAIYEQLRAGAEHVQIFYPEGVAATRSSVLDKSRLRMIAGGVNYFPDDARNSSVSEIDAILAPYSGHASDIVSVDVVQSALRFVESLDEAFSVEGYLDVFRRMKAVNSDQKAVLIVRRDRDVSQGTGSLLSPNDRAVGDKTSDIPVVTFYRLTGERGWGGSPLWVPNIKLPDGEICYTLKD